MTQHPEFDAEQRHIDHAYACLERLRDDAWRIRELTEASTGGTFQARFERNAFDEALLARLTQLDLGDAALVFGRIDRVADRDGTPVPGVRADGASSADASADVPVESFHIGRIAVADESAEPVVVDWRAPVAEPFYRATGRDPMGLARRRHLAVDGRKLLGIEDELFGAGHLGVGHDEGLEGVGRLRGYGTLLTVLARGRTGQLGDIVATIQAEQDEIIRSPQAGILVVEGGPGTGKTVVALHRAAYLLYTHRFPLENQGVLVVGPNRVFLRYIERVLPSLGEAGVEQAMLADLVPGAAFGARDTVEAHRVKGDARMARVVAKAVRDRERGLRADAEVPYGAGYLRLSAAQSRRIVGEARRRYRRHNPAQGWVINEMVATMLASSRTPDADPGDVREALLEMREFRAVLNYVWPILSPAELLHDLYGSRALLRLAAADALEEDEYLALHRPRAESLADARFSDADAPVLDEARALLGPAPRRNGRIHDADEIRTFGHIVIDEAQDLTPMQLRMVGRRSLNGAMTLVGDIAQATGPFAPAGWDDVLRHLPGGVDAPRDQRGSETPPRVAGLSVGYRIPTQIMDLAARLLPLAAPGQRAPVSVREGDAAPRVVAVAQGAALTDAIVAETRALAADVADGNAAVVCPDDMAEEVSRALDAAGVAHGRAGASALDAPLTVVPVGLVKGLELDGVLVVEPARIAAASPRGLRSLYVALTRSTRRLTVVHAAPLPASLVGDATGPRAD